MLTAEERAIKARWAAATPGPWRLREHSYPTPEGGDADWWLVGEGVVNAPEADATAIAAAPTDIAALLATVEALRGELADVLAERDAMQALATQSGRELAKEQAHKPGCARCSGRTDDAPCCRHHGDYLSDDGGRMVCAFCFRPCNDRHGGAT